MQARLQSLGLAGVLAYGLLNTLYYTSVFFTLWVYIVKVPRGVHMWSSPYNPYAPTTNLEYDRCPDLLCQAHMSDVFSLSNCLDISSMSKSVREEIWA